MEITEVTRYKVDGVEFDSLEKLQESVENRLYKIIMDGTDPRLSPQQQNSLMETILRNRNEIVKLLTIEYNPDPDNMQGIGMENILDRNRPKSKFKQSPIWSTKES